MDNQEVKKNVPIYFYYLTICKQKDSQDVSAYDIDQIVESFSKLLCFVYQKELKNRTIKEENQEKAVWLDSYENLGSGNFNLILKSAKYNHVRPEIDTQTMERLGVRKRQQDGEEEKTHLCIRLAKGQQRFIAVHESNHYGISINCIIHYLNEQFKIFNEESNDKYHYELSHEIMPGDDFLSSLKQAKTISLLRLTVSKDDLPNEFLRFAGRDDIKNEVDICIKRPHKAQKFPDNLIKEYYEDMQGDSKIKRIVAKGTNATGNFEAATDLIKMKHYLNIRCMNITNEVDSSDFFDKAQHFIDKVRNGA